MVLNETFEPFRSQVIEEEEKKGDIDASIAKEADERYQERRESELLLLLIRDDDGMIEEIVTISGQPHECGQSSGSTAADA